MSATTYYGTCYNQTVYPMKFCDITDQTECYNMNAAIAITPKVPAALSMIGASILIYRFFKIPKKNQKTYDRLILGMSIMNFWGSLGFFLGQWTFGSSFQNPFCSFQGWLLQINSAVYWYNACLATNFVLRIVYGWTEDAVHRYEPLLHLIAWFYPTITSFISLGYFMYGRAGQWCWIMVNPFDWARWAFFFAFLWILMIYTTICMILIVITVKRSDDQTAVLRDSVSSVGTGRKRKLGKRTREVAIQAILYVVTFLLTWVFGTANRIQNAVNPTCNVFALVWLHSLFVPLQGFFNFICHMYPRFKERGRKRKEAEKLENLKKDNQYPPADAQPAAVAAVDSKKKSNSLFESLKIGASRTVNFVFGKEESIANNTKSSGDKQNSQPTNDMDNNKSKVETKQEDTGSATPENPHDDDKKDVTPPEVNESQLMLS